MATRSKIVPTRRKPMSYLQFMSRHEGEDKGLEFLLPAKIISAGNTLADVFTAGFEWVPLPPEIAALANHPIIRLLTAASEENSPEAFQTLLVLFLQRLGVQWRLSLLVQQPGRPGRAKSSLTARIAAKWIEIGQPSFTSRKLAFAVYGAEFTKADSKQRKKMIDRCRQAVLRWCAQNNKR